MIRFTEEEYDLYIGSKKKSSQPPAKKYNKYKNIKVQVDGITFDSKFEAERYSELKILEKQKLIKNLELQPSFVLQDKFVDTEGKTHRAITYKADFSYINMQGVHIVEDVKGKETQVFKLKEKLFLCKYPDVTFRKIKKEKKAKINE